MLVYYVRYFINNIVVRRQSVGVRLFVAFFSSALNLRLREKYNTCETTRPFSDFAKVVIRCHLLYTFHFIIIYNKLNDVDARDVPARNIAPR